MVDQPDDVVIRALSGVDELGLFCGLQYVLDDELKDDLIRGLRRPSWMWDRATRQTARGASGLVGQRDG